MNHDLNYYASVFDNSFSLQEEKDCGNVLVHII